MAFSGVQNPQLSTETRHISQGILGASCIDSHKRRLHTTNLSNVGPSKVHGYAKFRPVLGRPADSRHFDALHRGCIRWIPHKSRSRHYSCIICCLCLSPGREAFKRREEGIGCPCRVTEDDVCYSTQKSRYRFDGKAFLWPVGFGVAELLAW